jgi:hypothetical protein
LSAMNDARVRLERNSITGAQELRRPETFTPNVMLWLVFAEGIAAWNALTDDEKATVACFVHQEWQSAKSNKQKIAATFFGNLLINMHTLQQPMIGEYIGD